MSNILDENDKIIPKCNTGNLYISDQDEFNNFKTKVDVYSKLSIGMCLLTMIFVWIFTLNFANYAWSLGNLVTFILIIICGGTVILAFKEWNISQTTYNKLVLEGSPCMKINEKDKELTNIYCGYNKNHQG